MAFGLPASSPKQEATGTVPVGGGPVPALLALAIRNRVKR